MNFPKRLKHFPEGTSVGFQPVLEFCEIVNGNSAVAKPFNQMV